MTDDKYQAVWVSHSSISDYLHCPKLYFLKNVYKEPSTQRKISLITPPLALGQAVHEVLESLSVLPLNKRFDTPLYDRLKIAWKKISGETGGFEDNRHEDTYYRRANLMINRVIKNPGPLKKLAVKMDNDLPNYWLSKKDNIILCGKIDWLEYIPESNSVHIIDFKTGKGMENENSLQLSIYLLLTANCQNRKVTKASFWYLDRDDKPIEQKLPEYNESHNKVLKIAKKIKLARQLNKFACLQGKEGCNFCRPMQKIIDGTGKLVKIGNFNTSIYVLKTKDLHQSKQSTIL